MHMPGIKNKGQALVIVMLVISALLIAGAMFIRAIFSETSSANLYIQKQKAFYLSEAGIEEGKSTLYSNPNWFTDNPHAPQDDVAWLIGSAKGSVRSLGDGSYKIVRESGRNIIYSIGYFKEGRSVLRVKYGTAPFKSFDFKIL